MTWLYVPPQCLASAPEPADSTSASDWRIPMLARSVTSSGRLSRSSTWLRRWKRTSWMRPLFGMISEPSTAARGVASWIGSLAESRANPTASPASVRERPTNGTSGPTPGESLKNVDLAQSSWKTFQASLGITSTASGLGYADWDTGLKRDFSQRKRSAPPHIRERLFVLGYADRAVLDFAKRGMEGHPLREGGRDDGSLGAGAPGDQPATAADGLVAYSGSDRRRRRHDSGSGRGPVADDQLVSAGSGSPLADGGGRRREREDVVRQGQSELDQRDADVAHGNGNGRGQGAAPTSKRRSQSAQFGEDVAHGDGVPGCLGLFLGGPGETQHETGRGGAWDIPDPIGQRRQGVRCRPNKARPSKNWEAYSRLVRMTLNRGHECSPKCRRLNPLFVAWLMGWPGGWTQLPSGLTGFESLATEWSTAGRGSCAAHSRG